MLFFPEKSDHITVSGATDLRRAGKCVHFPGAPILIVMLMAAAMVFFASDGRADSVKYESARVAVNIGNLRSAPSRDASLAGKVYRGATLQVLEKQGDWCRVRREDGVFVWAHQTILEKAPPGTMSPGDDKVIEEIRFEIDKGPQERVVFLLSEFFSPETFALEGERPRLVCDFYGVRLGSLIGGPMEINSNYVEGIRFGIYDEPSPRVRVVLDLVPGKDYSVEQFFFRENNHYTVVFSESS